MPRKSDGTFNQAKYQAEWRKKNMKSVVGNYKADFVEEFKEACAKLGIKQSQVIREAMQATIEKDRKERWKMIKPNTIYTIKGREDFGEEFTFYFDEQMKAHKHGFDDDHGHEVDDTVYIEDSDEIYVSGLYAKSSEWIEYNE